LFSLLQPYNLYDILLHHDDIQTLVIPEERHVKICIEVLLSNLHLSPASYSSIAWMEGNFLLIDFDILCVKLSQIIFLLVKRIPQSLSD